jgi:hypothetical protein
MTPCILVGGYQYFGGTYWTAQGKNHYDTAWYHNQEGHIMKLHPCENLILYLPKPCCSTACYKGQGCLAVNAVAPLQITVK